jgi:hypothetical protein
MLHNVQLQLLAHLAPFNVLPSHPNAVLRKEIVHQLQLALQAWLSVQTFQLVLHHSLIAQLSKPQLLVNVQHSSGLVQLFVQIRNVFNHYLIAQPHQPVLLAKFTV